MIHINTGEDQPHEWLTEAEFQARYGKTIEKLFPNSIGNEAKRIREMRVEKRLTIRELFKKSGLPWRTICDAEIGHLDRVVKSISPISQYT